MSISANQSGERGERARAYRRWRVRVISEGTKIRPIPAEYEFIERYPDNFQAARDAFHLEWLTAKLTKP